ncbi:MAG TPA: hypothetical protein VF794_01545 [Archangium sp.]|jgi:hypothetical protein|uniref:hypothetical protein n=1 Tax=Archangium sp. TaxID=1872627 RepID=UPI002ED95563
MSPRLSVFDALSALALLVGLAFLLMWPLSYRWCPSALAAPMAGPQADLGPAVNRGGAGLISPLPSP